MALYCCVVAAAGLRTGRQHLQTLSERHAADVTGQDEHAAALWTLERELLAEKASREQEWAATHLDLLSVAEKVRQLSDEVERLRGLLGHRGVESEEGTA